MFICYCLEVRHIMVLFGLISLTWLFAGLHLTYGHLWMIITFTLFNVFLVSVPNVYQHLTENFQDGAT